MTTHCIHHDFELRKAVGDAAVRGRGGRGGGRGRTRVHFAAVEREVIELGAQVASQPTLRMGGRGGVQGPSCDGAPDSPAPISGRE